MLVLAACGTEGGVDGGGAHLPNRGIAGWERIAPSDGVDFVLSAPQGDTWSGPAALVVDDVVFVWLTVSTAEGDSIHVSRSDDGAVFTAPTLVLAGADPSVVATDTALLMAYVADGGLALAESASPEGAFTPVSATNLPAASEPALVVDGDRLVLFAVTAEGAIVRSEAPLATLTFSDAEVVLAPVADCVDAFGETVPCWDGTALGGPDVHVATSPTGKIVWRMWLDGRQGTRADLGFAASEDGLAWTRYPFNPVFADSVSERAPTSVVFGDDYLMYWAETPTTGSGIAGARISPSATRSKPTERW